jgi:tetratricopeptide (TPR) repeat protein
MTALLMVFFWVLSQNAYSASAPETSSPTASEKREKSNVYFEKGLKLQEAGAHKEASKQYEKAVRADDSYAEAWSNLGYNYRKQGYYDKAITLSPNLAEAHEYLGEAYAEMGKFDLAENELKILRELGSNEADELEEFIAKSKTQ